MLNACAVAALVGCTWSPPHTPANPAGAYATAKYRNLFVEAGRSPQEVTERIHAAFQQLFHGEPRSQAVYFTAGANSNGPLACHVVLRRRVPDLGTQVELFT